MLIHLCIVIVPFLRLSLCEFVDVAFGVCVATPSAVTSATPRSAVALAMELVRDSPRVVAISKLLTQILRHSAADLGIHVGRDGYRLVKGVL